MTIVRGRPCAMSPACLAVTARHPVRPRPPVCTRHLGRARNSVAPRFASSLSRSPTWPARTSVSPPTPPASRPPDCHLRPPDFHHRRPDCQLRLPDGQRRLPDCQFPRQIANFDCLVANSACQIVNFACQIANFACQIVNLAGQTATLPAKMSLSHFRFAIFCHQIVNIARLVNAACLIAHFVSHSLMPRDGRFLPELLLLHDAPPAV